jgi:hypothetical protein
MTNEFSGHIAHRLYRIATLEQVKQKLCFACSALLYDKLNALSAPENPSAMGINLVNDPQLYWAFLTEHQR